MVEGVRTVLVAALCIASLALAGANVATPDVGPAEVLGGETVPAPADGSGGSAGGGEPGNDSGSDGVEAGAGGGNGNGGNDTSAGSGTGVASGTAGQNGSGAGGSGDVDGSSDPTEGNGPGPGTTTRNSTGTTAASGGPGNGAATPTRSDGGTAKEDDTTRTPPAGGTRGDADRENGSTTGSGTDPDSRTPTPRRDGSASTDSVPDDRETPPANDSSDRDRDDATSDGADSDTDSRSADGAIASGGYPAATTVGGPLELSAREEYVVRGPARDRWRLGAYARYTGSGWERDGGRTRRLTGRLSTVGDDTRGPVQEFRVTTRRSSETLLTAWRPAGVTADRRVLVDENRGLRVTAALPADTAYTTTSFGPPSQSAARDATGTEYPESVVERYTRLPADTPSLLGTRTDAITRDAQTPYETAAAIQAWLEDNKEYSLNASHDPDRDIATQFVEEMDEGYCQYFATSMVAMLRTQDVPARYVTGYAGGERVGRETTLRGRNAHTWVEVYFEDVGWVAFDPTPASGRAAAGRNESPVGDDGDAAGSGNGDADSTGGGEDGESESENGESGSENGESESEDSESGSEDGESGSQDSESGSENSESGSEDSESESEDGDDSAAQSEAPGPLEVAVDPEPVPGRAVTVTVERDGEPVQGATVSFNGESVGTTGSDGTVAAEVPYAATLNVTVAAPEADLSADPGRASAGRSPATGTREPLLLGPDEAVSTPLGPPLRDRSPESSVTFSLDTEISVDVPEAPVPGDAVSVRATIDGVPVRGARVALAEETASTNDEGAARLPVPFARRSEVTVTRGEASGNATLVVEHDLQIEAPGPHPAGADETVTVTVANRPVPNAAVTVGNSSATTAANGTARLPLPFEREVTVTAARGSLSTSRTIALERSLEVTVDGPVVPGLGTTVTVENGGDPIEGVSVSFASSARGTTDADGTLSFRPTVITATAGLVAERGPARGSAGPFHLWPFWLGYALLAGGSVFLVARRYGVFADGLPSAGSAVGRVGALGRWLDGTCRRAVLALVDHVARIIGRLRRLADGLRHWAVAAVRDFSGTLRLAAAGAREWFVDQLARSRDLASRLLEPAAWVAVVRWLLSLPSRIRRAGRRESGGRVRESSTLDRADRRTLVEDLAVEEDVTLSDLEVILDAWADLEAAADRRPEWTPAEVAARARELGYPPADVTELTRVFRRIRYGGRTPTDDMVETASGARAAIQEADPEHA